MGYTFGMFMFGREQEGGCSAAEQEDRGSHHVKQGGRGARSVAGGLRCTQCEQIRLHSAASGYSGPARFPGAGDRAKRKTWPGWGP